jgi:hypothetical protein
VEFHPAAAAAAATADISRALCTDRADLPVGSGPVVRGLAWVYRPIAMVTRSHPPEKFREWNVNKSFVCIGRDVTCEVLYRLQQFLSLHADGLSFQL